MIPPIPDNAITLVLQTGQGSAVNWQEQDTLWYLGGRRIIPGA